MNKPVIGLVAHYRSIEQNYAQMDKYVFALRNHGADCLMIPTGKEIDNIPKVVALFDGIVIPGGADVDPAFYRSERSIYCGMSNLTNDRYELELIKEAYRQRKPILGICRGLQLINVAFGGTLYQDIPSEIETEAEHNVSPDDKEKYHTVKVEKNTRLHTLLNADLVKTNSSHHQCVKQLAKDFKISARCTDGIVEGIEHKEANIVGVQWHPERMAEEKEQSSLFETFVQSCM